MIADDYDEELKDRYKNYLIAGFFFLFIFLVFFAVGCYLLVRQVQASKYTAIDAVVVDYKIVYVKESSLGVHGESTEPNYFDVVEYKMNGQKYRKTCDTPASKNNEPDNIGKIITIYVNQNNPDDVVFKNSTHIILTIACLVVPFCGFIGVSFAFIKAHKIKKML